MILIRTEGGDGCLSEETLARVTHYSDSSGLTTSKLFRKLLSVGIIETEGHRVRLATDWWAFLQIAKDEGAEDIADQKQVETHKQQRETFKERKKAFE